MTTHIMLDLETWGKRPGCDIRSIGACVFDPHAVGGSRRARIDETPDENGRVTFGDDCIGETFYIATDNPISPNVRPNFSDPNDPFADRTYPLHRDPDTVKWWSEQSEEAQSAFADAVDLRHALVQSGEWLMLQSAELHIYGNPIWSPPTDLRIYAHGPQFDISILEAAYHAVDLPVPWHYRAPRDTRTVFDIAGIDDHSAWLKQYPGPLGVPHHALDDAICQARAVYAAMERVMQ